MTLTFQLGKKVPGKDLIDVVEASVKEMEGWETMKEEGAYLNHYCAWSDSPFFKKILEKKDEEAKLSSPIFYGYRISSPPHTDALVGIRRYGGNGRKEFRNHCVDNALLASFLTISLQCEAFDYWDRLSKDERAITNFFLDDSIFTIINPYDNYSKLTFYGNAAFDFNFPLHSGRVVRENSPQYKKIEPAFNQLASYVRKRVPLPHPYRGVALVGE